MSCALSQPLTKISRNFQRNCGRNRPFFMLSSLHQRCDERDPRLVAWCSRGREPPLAIVRSMSKGAYLRKQRHRAWNPPCIREAKEKAEKLRLADERRLCVRDVNPHYGFLLSCAVRMSVLTVVSSHTDTAQDTASLTLFYF